MDRTRQKVSRTVSRRDVLLRGGAYGAFAYALGLAGNAQAQGVHGYRNRLKRYQAYKKQNPKPEQSWLDGILPNTKKAVDPASTPHPALFHAAMSCTDRGAKARLYCLKAIKSGDGTLGPCLQAVEAMIPVANALGKLSELDAVRLREMAKLSLRFLDDCETQCRQRGAGHPALQACAASCADCKRAVKTLLSS